MNNISEELIEIDGKEYTLFINRAGIVNWEKATKLQATAKDLEEKYKNITDGEVSEEDFEANPFGENDFDADEQHAIDIYRKFYFMALYKNHQLSKQEASDLFDKAIEEYGIDQLVELAQQMLTSANTNKQANLKNLKALKSTK